MSSNVCFWWYLCKYAPNSELLKDNSVFAASSKTTAVAMAARIYFSMSVAVGCFDCGQHVWGREKREGAGEWILQNKHFSWFNFSISQKNKYGKVSNMRKIVHSKIVKFDYIWKEHLKMYNLRRC